MQYAVEMHFRVYKFRNERNLKLDAHRNKFNIVATGKEA